MASHVSWLAFDADQQRQTQLLMAALNETSAIDELGLGVIRDLIAGALHPGLTVLHTRAKYLLFIPHDFTSLTGDSADGVAEEAEQRESATDHEPSRRSTRRTRVVVTIAASSAVAAGKRRADRATPTGDCFDDSTLFAARAASSRRACMRALPSRMLQCGERWHFELTMTSTPS